MPYKMAEGGAMNNSEIAYALSELLVADVTDKRLKKQQDTLNLVSRIIHENVSFDAMTDNEVEQLAMDIPGAMDDYYENMKIPEQIATSIRQASGYHRHLI